MPLYEYVCKECKKEFENIVRFSEANQKQDCPVCQSQNTHKKISKIATFGPLFGESSGATSNNCVPSAGYS
jgi:putative FmdB family regulatory protein